MHKLGTWVCLSGTTRSCLLYDLIVLKITDPSAQYCYLCDASYNFALVEIDQYGSTNDISALNNSEMEKAFEDGSMSLPQPEHLPGCGLPQLPFYLVGDEISALEPWLLRPYQGKIIKRKRAYLIIVCPEPEGLLRTV